MTSGFTVDTYLRAKQLGMPFTGHGRSPKTLASYRESIRRAEKLLGKGVSEMGEKDVERLLTAMEGLSEATRRHTLISLRGCLDWAIATGRYKGRNPFASVPISNTTRKLPKALTREQVEEFLTMIDGEKYRLFYSLMFYGGLRISEVTGLLKDHVLEDGLVIDGKGDRQRFVPLPKKVMDALDDWIERHPKTKYVFYGERGPTNAGPMSTSRARVIFEEAAERADLPDWVTPHTLRHTAATLMQSKHGDLALTQTFLGHASPVTTMQYVHVTNSALKKASSALFED